MARVLFVFEAFLEGIEFSEDGTGVLGVPDFGGA